MAHQDGRPLSAEEQALLEHMEGLLNGWSSQFQYDLAHITAVEPGPEDAQAWHVEVEWARPTPAEPVPVCTVSVLFVVQLGRADGKYRTCFRVEHQERTYTIGENHRRDRSIDHLLRPALALKKRVAEKAKALQWTDEEFFATRLERDGGDGSAAS